MTTGHYWYPDEHGEAATSVELLNELRRYRESNARMRSKTREDMAMGEKDLLALRYLMAAQAGGEQLRQQDLAEKLDIRAASVSALVDRLVRDGYVERAPHPRDRRSTAVLPTEHAHREVRETLHRMHQRMNEVAQSLSAEERSVIIRFLRRLNHSLDMPMEEDPGPQR